ncbi:unnamed protein product [Mortierella alpina]
MAGVQEESAFKEAEAILLSFGEYFQVQDDYLHVYGPGPGQNPEQRKILDDNCGRRDEANIQAVKEIYDEIDLQSLFRAYEDESYHRLKTLIAKADHPRLHPDVFTWLLELIYMRTK